MRAHKREYNEALTYDIRNAGENQGKRWAKVVGPKSDAGSPRRAWPWHVGCRVPLRRYLVLFGYGQNGFTGQMGQFGLAATQMRLP